MTEVRVYVHTIEGKMRAALEWIERHDVMWTAYPGKHEILERASSGNCKVRGEYGQRAHKALSALR